MDKAQKVLEILDKNGFDWFGIKDIVSWKLTPKGNIYLESTIYLTQDIGVGGYKHIFKSCSDLATNKSALEAGAKATTKKIMESDLERYLQGMLIYSLTYNNGDNFWDIFADFIGLEDE